VREVAVLGLADPKWGERIVACVAPSRAIEQPDALLAGLVEHTRAGLADYKKPRALYLCDALPRNALGKLQKHVLREAIEREGLTAE
jgi:malonyl-CoA/methylmalonyl-CoA synthetase